MNIKKTNKKLKKYLEDLYRKNKQMLYFHSEYEEKESVEHGIYFNQCIFVSEYSRNQVKNDLKKEAKRLNIPYEELLLSIDDLDNETSYYDKFLFEIQTFDSVMIRKYSKLGTVPYFQYVGSYPIFTVQKFGKLTDEDIFFAIEYFIHRILNYWFIFNINYNERQVHTDLEKWRPDYKKDINDLKAKKYWNEKKYYGVWT